MYIVVGLGNPGQEYENTRHNVGRLATEYIDGKVKNIKVFEPDTFMNKSGQAVARVVKSKKAAEKLVVIYDDLDLPFGSFRISYNRGSGGHKGIESIIRSLKTKAFIRIRVGITPVTPTGKLKKVKGEEKVEKHILGDFKKIEMDELKKTFKKIEKALESLVNEGLPKTMSQYNST